MALRLTSCLTRGFYNSIVRRSINPTQNMQRGARYLSGIADQFNKAKENVATLTQDPGNDVKLKMYALFKQVMFRGQGRGVKWGIKVHLNKAINPGGGTVGDKSPPPSFLLGG